MNEKSVPDLSMIMPCYNEESIIGYTIPRLLSAFEKSGYSLEIIAVDNGSNDKTGELIRKMAKENPSIVHHRVDKNEGYGYGVLCGIPLCTGRWAGIIPADGQVDAEDVVRLLDAAVSSGGNVVAKVRRRFRLDGLNRKIVSVAYNMMVQMLWPGFGSIDVNGSPKIMPRELLLALNLKSKGWLLDPELLIKSHYMGIRILELNVFGRMRGNGLSHVRAETCWEFFTALLAFRFSKHWRNELKIAERARSYSASNLQQEHSIDNL